MLGKEIPRPHAILVVSAHWYTIGTAVTAIERPETLYDFGYRNLDHIKYPAPGNPVLAERVAELLAPCPVVRDHTWGLDHGAWSVLLRLYPKADVPVVQLSIDGSQRPMVHFDLGRRLAPLRDEGVLIMGTGNIVHNLERYIRNGHPYPWAQRFDGFVRDRLDARDWLALVDYELLGEDAALSVPTPDHYLPLVYAIGAADPTEPVAFCNEAIEGGSMSMRTVIFGNI
jgi:4,5-DOPA dioxygenase extradiol